MNFKKLKTNSMQIYLFGRIYLFQDIDYKETF